MTQEELNNEVQIRLAVHEEKFNAVLSKIDNLSAEMRDRDNRRAAENEEIRQSIKEIYTTTDAKIAEIRQAIDGMGKHVRNVSYATIAAVGAMVVTVLLNLPKG